MPQVQDVYRLLVDSSPVLRRAAAGMVAGLLEELGQRAVAQVGPLVTDSSELMQQGQLEECVNDGEPNHCHHRHQNVLISLTI